MAENANKISVCSFFTPKKAKVKFDKSNLLYILKGTQIIVSTQLLIFCTFRYIALYLEVFMTEDKTTINDGLDTEQRYEVGDLVFIVKPTFKQESKHTLATILLSLMQGEVETA